MTVFKKILKVDKDNRAVVLPEDFIGESVEVIAFPVREEEEKAKEKISAEDFFKDKLVDLSNYKFDRLEANDYD